MSDTPDSDRNQPLPAPTPGGITAQVVELLEKATPSELRDIQAHLSQEGRKRMEKAERELEERQEKEKRELDGMRKILGLSEPQPAARSKSVTKSSGAKSTRAPRGQSKEAIIAFLTSDGPKDRRQIEEHFKAKGLSTASISTLLTRLKKDGAIKYHDENKHYSSPSESKK